ncbi:MAG: apolipoprotein N-acyltransferase [Candidatus Omnitrophota bacterium]
MNFISILLSIFSALLLALSFPVPGWGFLAWIAFLPWFFALQREKEKPIVCFFLSYLAGTVFFLGCLWWVACVTWIGFVVLALYLGLYFAFFGLFFSKAAANRGSSGKMLLSIPCLWVALEYARSHLLTGFGWVLLGYSQYQVLPVIQISDLTGAYGVSFLILLVNTGLWMIARRETIHTKRGVSLCVLFFLALALGYGYAKLSYCPREISRVKVTAIQGNIPQTLKWDAAAREDILKKYFQLTETAAKEQSQLIIWPETAVPGFLENDPELTQRLSGLSEQVAPAALLAGAPFIDDNGQIYNRAALFSRGQIRQYYDKIHLVPFGEFVPWPAFFSRFAFADLIANFTAGKEYTVFSFPAADFSKTVQAGVLICFEDAFAYLARRFVQQGARVLINITNDAWFGDSGEPYQHLAASAFRAVENRVNLVRSANTGISCFITPWGKIFSRVRGASGRDLLVEGSKTEQLSIVSFPSFYSKFGDIFSWLCVIIGLGALVRRGRNT